GGSRRSRVREVAEMDEALKRWTLASASTNQNSNALEHSVGGAARSDRSVPAELSEDSITQNSLIAFSKADRIKSLMMSSPMVYAIGAAYKGVHLQFSVYA
ncbi:hypothetical protein SDJN02_06053, partial [Cucurbita argyrosperma subsp. argyrosperma]